MVTMNVIVPCFCALIPSPVFVVPVDMSRYLSVSQCTHLLLDRKSKKYQKRLYHLMQSFIPRIWILGIKSVLSLTVNVTELVSVGGAGPSPITMSTEVLESDLTDPQP
jgi:hypothetical protein